MDEERVNKCIDVFNLAGEMLAKMMAKFNYRNIYESLAKKCKEMGDRRRLAECLTSLGIKEIFNCICATPPCKKAVERARLFLDEADEIQTNLQINKGNSRAQCISKLGRCPVKSDDKEGGKALVEVAIRIRKAAIETPSDHEEEGGENVCHVMLAATYNDKAGCGTGKYLGLAPDSFVIGSDSCVEFAEIAVQRGHNVVACDNQSLPFRESCFDAVISVGVIHHFASGKRRSKALEELYRILRPGGRMLVYVWAFEQEQRKFDGQDVLVPYTHFQRNKVLARRSMSVPVRPRHQAQFPDGTTPNMSTSSWRSGRAHSCLDSFGGDVYKRQQTQKAKGEDSSSNETGLGRVQVKDTSKYAILQKIRNQEKVSSLTLEKSEGDNPVQKLSKFLNSILKKVFNNADDDGGESENLTIASASEKTHQRNGSSANASSEFSPKFSALMSYFSSEKRETILKAEVLSLIARKLFAWKDNLRLDDDFDKTLDNCDEIDKEQHENVDVVIGLKEENVSVGGTCGHQGPRTTTGVSLDVMARLVDSLALPSDMYDDSSSSGDALTSDDSSSAEDWNQVEASLPTHSKKTFQHTTISCQEPTEPVCAADKDSQYLSSSSFFSSTASSSSQSSPLPSSSSSSPRTETSPKLARRKLQRYYHVFCAGELLKLVQDGIPSAVILKEYYDHGNWAVILEKAISREGCVKTL